MHKKSQQTLTSTVTCNNCLKSFNENDALEENGRKYCLDCQEQAFLCEKHDDYSMQKAIDIKTNNSNIIENWCENCTKTFAEKCYSCGDLFSHKSILNKIQGSSQYYVCDECLESSSEFFTCKGCGDSFFDEVRSRTNSEFCFNCVGHKVQETSNYIESEEADVLSEEYGLEYDPEILTGTTKPYIGIEFETKFKQFATEEIIDKINSLVRFQEKFAIIKEESSLDNEGIEIVSIPMLLEDQKKKWDKFFQTGLQKELANEDGTSGIHIHLNRNSLSNIGLARLMFLIYGQNGNRRFTQIISERTPNAHWSLRNQKIKDYYKDIDKQKDRPRSEAINLQNPNTIEFRMFNSVNDSLNFNKNLEYVDAVYNFCNNEIFIRPMWNNFLEWVRTKKEDYPNLNSFLDVMRNDISHYMKMYVDDVDKIANYVRNIFSYSNMKTKVFYKNDHNGSTVFCSEDGMNWWHSTENGMITPLCGSVPNEGEFEFVPIEKINN